MALHNIKIVVVDGGREGSYKSKNAGLGNAKNKNTPLYKLLNAKETLKNKITSGMSPVGVMTFNMGTQLAKQFASQAINYYVSGIGMSNGDVSLQQNINREIEIVTDGFGLLSNTMSGAATGSMFGPIGASIGAVAGFASSAISLGYKKAGREREYNYKIFKENNAIEYNRARAEINITNGRLR